MLYKAFDWSPPEFAHLPQILNKDGHKLSKRNFDQSVEEFRVTLSNDDIMYVVLLEQWVRTRIRVEHAGNSRRRLRSAEYGGIDTG